MIVARVSHGQVTIIDRLREMVRLAAGLDENNELSQKSEERALGCLSRFGERIREMRADQVRVVGTNTLRKARSSGGFLAAAADRLGHPVEIISGIEEARLIYLGVSHSMPLVEGPQIVIDIGGGSTEIVRGTGYEPEILESLYLGCVSLSKAVFGPSKLTARRFERARLAARLELAPVSARFQPESVHRYVGASGTIRAAQRVLQGLEGEDALLTRDGLERLINRMIDAGKLDRLSLPGLSDERKPVFAGGVSILVELMAALGADVMQVADGALREGIVYDLFGRLTKEDARVRTVRAMMARYNVDLRQAKRVEATALALLAQVADKWALHEPEHRSVLKWAARLHEMGLDIAHAHYHRHGAYLLEHADMPGFPREEQRLLARLVGAHRRSFSRQSFNDLPPGMVRSARRLAVLLRLAVLFNRSRVADADAPVELIPGKELLTVAVPEAWLEDNPLTLADLKLESGFLRAAGLQMQLDRRG
ncbi:MAG: Ppx/GppA family phosphatase [Chromatiales bacterium]|nr:MAG: Ppx/GppA family phosphatase [Chromatiales bacterium]